MCGRAGAAKNGRRTIGGIFGGARPADPPIARDAKSPRIVADPGVILRVVENHLAVAFLPISRLSFRRNYRAVSTVIVPRRRKSHAHIWDRRRHRLDWLGGARYRRRGRQHRCGWRSHFRCAGNRQGAHPDKCNTAPAPRPAAGDPPTAAAHDCVTIAIPAAQVDGGRSARCIETTGPRPVAAAGRGAGTVSVRARNGSGARPYCAASGLPLQREARGRRQRRRRNLKDEKGHRGDAGAAWRTNCRADVRP